MKSYFDYMISALEQAKFALVNADVPVGAVIVDDKSGEIIGEGYNRVENLGNPLAHAEMIAINNAVLREKRKFFNDCTIFVTLEPCPMCAGAIMLARIGKVVFGASEPKFGSCGSLYNIASDIRLNHQAEIIGGILENECSELLKNFFTLKR